VQVSRQNRRLLFAVAICLVFGVLLAFVLEQGIGKVGEKERALALSEQLAACTTHEQYLALLSERYPPDSRLWQSPAMKQSAGATSPTIVLERLADGRFRVVVFAVNVQGLFSPSRLIYFPAALADEHNHGYRLDDVRINSRKDKLVFEYFYGGTQHFGTADSVGRFRFFLGQWQWEILSPRTKDEGQKLNAER